MKAVKKSTRRTTKKSALFVHVAVIVAEMVDPDAGMAFVPSKRSHGDWSSFVGTDRAEVIRRAKASMDEWQKSHGPYIILVGTLTGQAKFPTQFTVVPL